MVAKAVGATSFGRVPVASRGAPPQRPMTGQGRRLTSAVAWSPWHPSTGAAPQRGRWTACVRGAVTDVARATSAFAAAAAGGASSLEDDHVLHTAPVARPGDRAAPRCDQGMAEVGHVVATRMPRAPEGGDRLMCGGGGGTSPRGRTQLRWAEAVPWMRLQRPGSGQRVPRGRSRTACSLPRQFCRP